MYGCMVILWLYSIHLYLLEIYTEKEIGTSKENIYRINGEVSSNPSPKMLKIVPHAGPDRRCMVYLVGVMGKTHSHKESRLET